MLQKRLLVVLLILPVGLAAIFLGGYVYAVVIALILGLSAYEYVTLFQAAGYKPSVLLSVGGTVFIVIGRQFRGAQEVLGLFVLLALAYHLLDYERGRNQAASDFAVTVSAILYIGWLGAYLILLRNLPGGMWWILLALPAIWLADSFAYLVGVRFGRHKMTHRLSPKKSWEGFLGGILASIVGTVLLALLVRALGAGPEITPLRAAILALAISSLGILGDLGESMIKRQAGMKDSGHLLPGHGGVFDRIDSWLWAGVVGYYIITLFFY